MPLDSVQSVQIDKTALYYALRDDAEFFIHFFMKEQLTKPVPKFHIEEFHKMTHLNVRQYCAAIPRDHAKTTLAKLAVVHFILFSNFCFPLYVSSVHKLAVAAVNDIIAFLEEPNAQQFVSIEWKKKQDGVGHYEFVISIWTPGGVITKECSILAAGAGQALRGMNIGNQRPDLAIVDDLEKKEDIAYNEEAYIKLKQWFYGTFKKALNKFKNKIIQLGNIVANKCIIQDHCNSPYWHSTKYGCILANGKPLWPDAWSIEALIRDFQEYSLAGMLDVWYAEMMNAPTEGKSKLIKISDIIFREQAHPADVEHAFIICDPAISKEKWAHKCAISAHGFVDGKWQLVDYTLGKDIDPIQMRNIAHEMAFKWRAKTIGIEAVAFQASLQVLYPYMDKLESKEFFNYVPLYKQTQKAVRIGSWFGMLKNKAYALTAGDMVTVGQILNFDPNDRNGDNDLIDTCGYVTQMLTEFAGYVYELLDIATPGHVQGSYEVCDI